MELYNKSNDLKINKMSRKEEIIKILNKYTTMYLGGMKVITDVDFDDLASEISDL